MAIEVIRTNIEQDILSLIISDFFKKITHNYNFLEGIFM